MEPVPAPQLHPAELAVSELFKAAITLAIITTVPLSTLKLLRDLLQFISSPLQPDDYLATDKIHEKPAQEAQWAAKDETNSVFEEETRKVHRKFDEVEEN